MKHAVEFHADKTRVSINLTIDFQLHLGTTVWLHRNSTKRRCLASLWEIEQSKSPIERRHLLPSQVPPEEVIVSPSSYETKDMPTRWGSAPSLVCSRTAYKTGAGF
ncbi:hypothetical protein VTN00DRAFT_1234 [Thermoascus crustaceus]|uniref:uncharacterized protein n=1 Tax=Thermoascus crustaceus TaxID=5088 RepID=UPI003742D246